MASRFIALFSMLVAVANAGVIGPLHYTATPVATVAHKVAYANPAVDSVASTHQNVVRSFDGTVSTYSKAVDTPYSSVRKEDTRISNNVYTPAIQKTVTYASAPLANTYAYAPAPAPVVEKKTIAFAAPVISKPVLSYAAAPVTKSYLAPAHSAAAYSHPSTNFYTSAVPKVVATETAVLSKPIATLTAAPATTSYSQGSSATTYTHSAPGASGYGSSQIVHYSPAELVSHMSFDGFGTHWGY